ncbi:hypothetical protein GCM10018965_059940 [Nonomuraea roseola]
MHGAQPAEHALHPAAPGVGAKEALGAQDQPARVVGAQLGHVADSVRHSMPGIVTAATDRNGTRSDGEIWRAPDDGPDHWGASDGSAGEE